MTKEHDKLIKVLKGPYKYKWTCGDIEPDPDGAEGELTFTDEHCGEITTWETDEDIVESLCADEYRLEKYGDKNYDSDYECDRNLDSLTVEKVA